MIRARGVAAVASLACVAASAWADGRAASGPAPGASPSLAAPGASPSLAAPGASPSPAAPGASPSPASGASPAAAAADPVAQRAGEEANLATEDKRQGFFAHAGLGPSVTIGGGTGTGAGATLLFGAAMRPTWVAILALTANAQRHEVMDQIHINDYTTFGVGLQWWPSNAAIHGRGTVGFGAYRCRQCTNPDEPLNPIVVDYLRRGANLTIAVGVDLVRFKGLVWGLDFSVIGTAHADGVITAIGLESYLSLD